MAIRDLLILLDSSSRAIGPYGLSFAALFGAHTTAVALVPEPPLPPSFTEVPYEAFDRYRDQVQAAAQHVLNEFARSAQSAGVACEIAVIDAMAGAGARGLARLARHADLTLLEQADPDAGGPGDLMIEAALFGSGRPVLIVPFVHKQPAQIQTVLVAWDGSQAAARAVADALPILRQARSVQVVTVVEQFDEAEPPGLEITRHLGRHDIQTEIRQLISVGDVANTLLSHAADVAADLLVMGGYGHSRFREIVLGGATREILASMTIPVLMSH